MGFILTTFLSSWNRLLFRIVHPLSEVKRHTALWATGHFNTFSYFLDSWYSFQTNTNNFQVVCRQCFVRTIQMAVAQKRLPLRCILCRAKVLRIKQDHRDKDGNIVQSKNELVHSDDLSELPKSVSGYNINNYISSSGSNYSFTSGKWQWPSTDPGWILFLLEYQPEVFLINCSELGFEIVLEIIFNSCEYFRLFAAWN